MPPKVKITKEDIVKTAIDLSRKSGHDAINARAIALALNCSTQPIFSNFNSMDELEKEMTLAIYEIYLNFIKEEVESKKYPQYKAFGMAYIRFAMEEKELFKLLFMRGRTGGELIPTQDFDASVEMIMNTTGISREKAALMHLEMWTCVHGISTMLVTSFVSLEWELISTILTDVYHGICARHLSEEKQ